MKYKEQVTKDLPTLEIKKYVMIDGQNVFNQTVKHELMKNDSIRKIKTSQGDDYITGCFTDYNCYKNYYKMIAKDLCNQQELGTDNKVIIFSGNLNKQQLFFIIEQVEETVLSF